MRRIGIRNPEIGPITNFCCRNSLLESSRVWIPVFIETERRLGLGKQLPFLHFARKPVAVGNELYPYQPAFMVIDGTEMVDIFRVYCIYFIL